MIYSNFEFILLLLIVVPLYRLFPAYSFRLTLLLAASVLFYLYAGVLDLTLLIFAILVPFFVARFTQDSDEETRGKWVFAGISILVLNLFYWKYTPWVSSMVSDHPIRLPLPIGISFFTLQSIAYLIDYRHGAVKPATLPQYGLFLSFFPQVVAGPICRNDQLMPQVHRLATPKSADYLSGISLFLLGFAKKAVIADRLAPILDPVFENPSEYTAVSVALAVFGYSVQIWADFSGYTDMGRGAGRMLGFHLPVNFRSPYLALSPSEYWQRWHISLSTWIQDYLFNPLMMRALRSWGGGTFAIFGAIVLTMTVSGLWHGAGWTFLLWGIYHGALLVLEKKLALTPLARWSNRQHPFISTLIRWSLMFLAIQVSWIFFRAQGGSGLRAIFDSLFWNPGPYQLGGIGTIIVAGAFCFLVQIVQYTRLAPLQFVWLERWKSLSKIPLFLNASSVKACLSAALLGVTVGFIAYGLILLRHSGDSKAFIYFQF